MPRCTCLVVGSGTTSWMAHIWIPVWLHSCAAPTQTVTDGGLCSRAFCQSLGALCVNLASRAFFLPPQRAFCQGLGVLWVNLASSLLSTSAEVELKGAYFELEFVFPASSPYHKSAQNPRVISINSRGYGMCARDKKRPNDAPVSRITRESHWLQLYGELRTKAKYKFLLS